MKYITKKVLCNGVTTWDFETGEFKNWSYEKDWPKGVYYVTYDPNGDCVRKHCIKSTDYIPGLNSKEDFFRAVTDLGL